MASLPALPFVRAAVSEGLSANAAYRQFREQAASAGLSGIRRQDFLRIYSQTLAARARVPEMLRAPKDTIPSDIQPRDTVHARGYGSWVLIMQRTRAGSDFFAQPWLIKSRQPITPAEAEQRALAYLQTEPDQYNRTTLGVTFLNAERYTPGL